MAVEPHENGQGDQPLQRRPPLADAASRPTDGFFHSQTLGLAGAETAPKSRQSSIRTTLNGNDGNSAHNRPTAQPTARKKPSPIRSAWDLPRLIRPLPIRRQQRPRRPRLLRHYPAVVEFVYQNRYATGFQIQRRFPEYLRSPRTMQFQLASLVQLGFLGIAPVRSTSPNFPYVYFASGRGVRLIRETYAGLGHRWNGVVTEAFRERGSGLQSILHELLVTEFDLSVWEALEGRPDLERVFVERRYFRRDKRLCFDDQGTKRCVFPDSGFVLRVQDGRSLLHLTELDNGTMAISRIREKLGLYEAWGRSPEGLACVTRRPGAEGLSSAFRLLVIAHSYPPARDFDRLAELLLPALELSATFRDSLWLTTAEAVRRCPPDPPATPIWWRARDAKTWLPKYKGFVHGLPDHSGRKRFVQQRRFVRSRLEEMPRHSLWPRHGH